MEEHERALKGAEGRTTGAAPKILKWSSLNWLELCFKINHFSDVPVPLPYQFLSLADQWHLLHVLWSGVCTHKHSRGDQAN